MCITMKKEETRRNLRIIFCLYLTIENLFIIFIKTIEKSLCNNIWTQEVEVWENEYL